MTDMQKSFTDHEGSTSRTWYNSIQQGLFSIMRYHLELIILASQKLHLLFDNPLQDVVSHESDPHSKTATPVPFTSVATVFVRQYSMTCNAESFVTTLGLQLQHHFFF